VRILVLSKRQYTNRDLIDDRYGRIRELPLVLSSLGHDVRGLCLSYRPRDEGMTSDVREQSQVQWRSLNIHRLVSMGRSGYQRTAKRMFGDNGPDLIWACSDAPHAILGAQLAKRLCSKLVIDLYDNFESFGVTKVPGILAAFRSSIRHADGVTCISAPLSHLVRERYRYRGPIEIVENGVPDEFRAVDRDQARRTLGLPGNGVLIGTAGSLSASRGIEALFAAFGLLSAEQSDVHLVLAGPRDRRLKLPVGDRVHDLGVLDPVKVPVLLSALDVSVVCNRDSEFGRYCFPQKFYESVACQTPVVVASTGVMRDLLTGHPECLFEPENSSSLAATIRAQLASPSPLKLEAPTWEKLGRRLSGFFERVCGKANVSASA
jgi:teichuronic acid biosynthesis glycosyltransferase TuaC